MSAGSVRFYRGVRWCLRRLFGLWFSLEVIGSEKVPAEGGFILAPGSHRSILDTPIVSSATDRVLRYMGAEAYFDTPGLGHFLRSVGGFAVERDATDRDALRISEEVLRRGEPLVIFPEGTRQTGPEIGELKQGAAFLAHRAEVPLVPVGIGGAAASMPPGSKKIRRAKMVLVVGDPIHPGPREPGSRVKRSAVKATSAALASALVELWAEAEARTDA